MSFMRFDEFLDTVWQMAKSEGQPYIRKDDRVRLKALANRRLRTFTELTKCLYDDEIEFTPAVDDSVLSLVDTDKFSRMIVEPLQIILDGEPMLQMDQKTPGPWNRRDVLQQFPDYLTADSDKPVAWFLIGTDKIRFVNKFDDDYSNCFAQAYVYHSELVEDNDLLELPNHSGVVDVAAMFTAVGLLTPFGNGEGWEKIDRFRQTIKEPMDALTNKAVRFGGGINVRKSVRRGGALR